MLEFGDTIYYLDLDALDKTITPKGVKPNDKLSVTETKSIYNAKGELIGIESQETTSLRGKEIDGAKYEVIRTMIEVVLDDEDDQDTSLGAERALDKTPLSYKVAFNTLLHYGILKEKE